MPNYPTKVQVLLWATGEDGEPDEVYSLCPDGLYRDGSRTLSTDPITRQPDGTWRTPNGTVVRSVCEEVELPTAFKADTGKPRWTLLLDCVLGCGRAVRAVVRVLNFAVRPVTDGGKGYIPHSWRQVPEARQRYEDALHRHLDAIRDGETHDAESGESHWAHVATNALFLWELDNPKEKTDE